ncbi:MAG: hypothetical protein KBF89_00065 [Acidimicrobiia bacterium]|nr:hypothetical protein [Acidimicrobiia bacterium]
MMKLNKEFSTSITVIGASSIAFSLFSQIDSDLINFIKMGNSAAITLIVLGIATILVGLSKSILLLLGIGLAYLAMCITALYQFRLPGKERIFDSGGSLFSLTLGFCVALLAIALTNIFYTKQE